MRTLLLLLLLAVPAAAEGALVMVVREADGLYAEVSPDFDYTVYAARRYRLKGDAQAGLARLVDGQAIPVAPGSWRGRLPGRKEGDHVVLAAPDGPLQVWLEPGVSPPSQDFTLEATCVPEGDRWRAYDASFSPHDPPSIQAGQVRFLGQLSEEFLDHCAREFLYGHRLGWSDPDGLGKMEVSRLGITLLGCGPGEVRLFGAVTGEIQSQPLFEGRFEIKARPHFEGARLRLTPLPGSLTLGMTRPIRADLPADWTRGLADLISQDLLLPVPEAYADQLMASGILSAEDIANFRVWTLPTGDRRTSMIIIAGPAVTGPGPNLARRRLSSASGFALALAPEAVTGAIRYNLELPIREKIPREAGASQRVFLFTVRLTEIQVDRLQLAYGRHEGRGVLIIEDCEVSVFWDAGIASGREPGAQIKGHAEIIPRPGPPMRFSLRPVVQYLEFLSPTLRSRSPEEQQALRERILAGLAQVELEMPLAPRLPVPPLSGRAGLELTSLEAHPEELVLQGRLLP